MPDAIENIMKTFDMSRFTEDCRDIKKAAIERIKVIEEQTKALNIKKDYAMKELKEFKNALRHWLDTIEESAVKNLENACAKLRLKWTDEISNLRKRVNELEQYEAKLEAVTKNESQKFVCASLGKEIVSTTVKQTEEVLQKLKNVSFTPAVVLNELLTSHTILGTSSLTFDQEPVIRGDTLNMTSQPDDSQLRKELKQLQLIAQLKANGALPPYGPELAKLMFVGAKVVPGRDWVST